MITRRSFLAALACLPVVGQYVKTYNASLAAGATESAVAPARQDREYVEDREIGIRMRFVKEYDIVFDQMPNRWDGYMGEDGRIHWIRTTVTRIKG